MSIQQVADAVTELGVPMPRPVLSNLETGRRSIVSQAEGIALAYVLGVPPILLLYPVGQQQLIEVLPGREIPTWLAAKWFTGEVALVFEPSYDDDGQQAGWASKVEDVAHWNAGAAPVTLFRDHDEAYSRWRQLSISLANSNDASIEYRQSLSAEVRRVEAQLALIRDGLRQHHLTPPGLAPNLRHVDDIDPAEAVRRVNRGAP